MLHQPFKIASKLIRGLALKTNIIKNASYNTGNSSNDISMSIGKYTSQENLIDQRPFLDTHNEHISENNGGFYKSNSFIYIPSSRKLPTVMQQQEKDLIMNKFPLRLQDNGAAQSLNLISYKTENKQTIDPIGHENDYDTLEYENDYDTVAGKNYHDYGVIKDEQCNVPAEQFVNKTTSEKVEILLKKYYGVDELPDMSLICNEVKQTVITSEHNYCVNDNSSMQSTGEQVEIDASY